MKSLGALAYLVKPLDVGQIVPAVEAAFGRLRQGLVEAHAPAVPLPSAPGPLLDPVPLALGVLMHRYSLPRDEAWRRLQRLAQEQRLPLAAQAERLLAAVEELARSS